jgi:hypothetical protein
MEFKEHMKNSLRSYLTNRSKKVEVKSPNTTKHFFMTGVQWNMEFAKDKFFVSLVQNI